VIDGNWVPLTLVPLEGASAGFMSDPHWTVSTGGGVRVWYRVDEGDLHDAAGATVTASRVLDGVEYRVVPSIEIPGAPDGARTFFAEAITPSASLASAGIECAVFGTGSIVPSGQSEPVEYWIDIRNRVAVTAATLKFYDLRHWGPRWSDHEGGIVFDEDDATTVGAAREVGGAITDGVSTCMIRVHPPDLASLPTPKLRVRRLDEAFTDAPAVVGALKFHDPLDFLNLTTPAVPIGLDPAAEGLSSEAFVGAGSAFYVPPPNYLDAVHNQGAALTLDDGEATRIGFEFTSDGQPLFAAPFILRRPPIVLAHGLWGSPDSFHPDPTESPWHDLPGVGFETRLYRVDYEASNQDGYDQNLSKVVDTVETALWDYRLARDDFAAGHDPLRGFHGVRYAATRVDVVAHSMGGTITRLWISDANNGLNEPRADRPSFPISIDRSGLNNYRFGADYSAGSIRRFVSIGSPFDGSSLAVAARTRLEFMHVRDHARAFYKDPKGWLQRHGLGNGPGEIDEVGEMLVVPEAILDLAPNSNMQQLIDGANFPSGRWRVAWHPVVGIASQDIPVSQWKDTLWDGVFNGAGALVLNGLGDLDFTDGDVVVHRSSQANGQYADAADHLSVFNLMVHLTLPDLIMSQFGLESELRSDRVRDRVRELLSTARMAEWTADLSQ